MKVYEFLSQKPCGPLYHYTDARGLIGILEQRELWASNALHLNDAEELGHGMRLLRAEVERQRLSGTNFPPVMLKQIDEWTAFGRNVEGRRRPTCCIVLRESRPVESMAGLLRCRTWLFRRLHERTSRMDGRRA